MLWRLAPLVNQINGTPRMRLRYLSANTAYRFLAALSRHPANVVCSHARSRITFAPAWFSAPAVPVVRDVRYAQTRYEHARLRIVCGAHPPFLFECLAIPAVVKIAQRNYVSNANLLLIIGQLNNYAWLDRKRDATINPKRGLSTPVLPACLRIVSCN